MNKKSKDQDIQSRYDRKFLDYTNEYIKNSSNDKYKPLFHINPSKGLLNDPNCVFYKNNTYYIFFQHHANKPVHGLKTMSLAKTKDFKQFEYKYMVNKPNSSYDFHGNYTGNAILFQEKIITLYTGNKRDENWIRTSYIIYSEFDIDKEEFINKKIILNNFDFLEYTEHFRDPYIFEFKNELFFLLGAQTREENGVILLFKFDIEKCKATLINEIKTSNEYRMIECPNVVFIDNKAVLIYSPQYKMNKINENQNPDIVRYFVTNKDDFLSIKNINKEDEKIIDYGLEYYAPQTFKKDNDWFIIAWSGIPTSIKYPETINGWIFVLSMVKKVNIKNDQLILEPLDDFKNNFIKQKNNHILYKEIEMKDKDILFIKDSSNKIMELSFFNKTLTIKRNNDEEYFPYESKVDIILESNKIQLDIYIDISIIEININKEKWYTSRIYFEKENIYIGGKDE